MEFVTSLVFSGHHPLASNILMLGSKLLLQREPQNFLSFITYFPTFWNIWVFFLLTACLPAFSSTRKFSLPSKANQSLVICTLHIRSVFSVVPHVTFSVLQQGTQWISGMPQLTKIPHYFQHWLRKALDALGNSF